MPGRFVFSLAWFSGGPIVGEAMAHIFEKMAKGGFLEELDRAGVKFSGDTAYGPHTTIRFEADTLAQGFRFADMISNTLQAKFSLPGTAIRVNGMTRERIIELFEETLAGCARRLKETRTFFRNADIAYVRRHLEKASALEFFSSRLPD